MSPETNITWGLWSIVAGLALGAPLSIAFFRSAWLGGYGSLERRLLRLAHVALVALGALNVVYGGLVAEGLVRPAQPGLTCSALVAGGLLMPLLLLASVRFRPALWALGLPFVLFFAGALSIALGRS